MTFINFSDPKFWVDLLQLIGMVVIALVLFARRPGEEATKSLVELDKRVIVLEQKIINVPTSEEMAELAGMVKVIEAQGEAQVQRMDALADQLTRIETYLLHKK